MKKYIILSGSLLLVVIMLLTPSIPAMEYKAMNDKIQSDSYIKLEGLRKNIKELKSLVNDVNINFKLIYVLLRILTQGLLLPTIFVTLILLILNKIGSVYPIVSYILASIGGIALGLLFEYPILLMFIDVSSHKLIGFLTGYILSFLLGLISIKLAGYIVEMIDNNPGMNASVSGLRSRIESLLNVG